MIEIINHLAIHDVSDFILKMIGVMAVTMYLLKDA